MGKYYDHPSELKHMILDQISRSNGLTGAEIEGIRTELAQTQLYRYRRQGLLRCESMPTQTLLAKPAPILLKKSDFYS